jgi:hypothetical protein
MTAWLGRVLMLARGRSEDLEHRTRATSGAATGAALHRVGVITRAAVDAPFARLRFEVVA